MKQQQSYVWRIPARRVPRRPDEIGPSSKSTTQIEIGNQIENENNKLVAADDNNSPTSPTMQRRSSYSTSRRRESAGSEHDGLRRRNGLAFLN